MKRITTDENNGKNNLLSLEMLNQYKVMTLSVNNPD